MFFQTLTFLEKVLFVLCILKTILIKDTITIYIIQLLKIIKFLKFFVDFFETVFSVFLIIFCRNLVFFQISFFIVFSPKEIFLAFFRISFLEGLSCFYNLL